MTIVRIIVFCLRYLSFVVVAFIYWNLHTFAYVSALHIKKSREGIKSLIWLNQPDREATPTRDPSDRIDRRHYSPCKMSRVHVVSRSDLFTVDDSGIEYGSGFNMYLSVLYRRETEAVFHWQIRGQTRQRPPMFYV